MSSKSYNPSTSNLLILLPLALITLGFILYPIPNKSNVVSFFTTSFSALSASSNGKGDTHRHQPDDDSNKLNILFGIITKPSLHKRRQLLRSVYAVQTVNLTGAHVDVRFVFCNTIYNEDRMFIALDIRLYNDIVILDCEENMNNGKTYTYFSSLPSMFGTGHQKPYAYDYVVKADDDAYFRLDNLVSYLNNKPREDFYCGMELPCDYQQGFCGVHKTFMAGFGYVLSWDLVEWIAASDVTKSNRTGPEDMLLARWLNTAGKGKNRYDAMPFIHDYSGNSSENYRYRHPVTPETIAVHQLKGNVRWIKVLEFFNVTDNLKP